MGVQMPEKRELRDGAFLINNLLTPQECCELIDLSEATGYRPASISSAGSATVVPELRNNDRVMIVDFELAARLWRLAKPFVPASLDGRLVVGLNERLRFYRYTRGHRFKWHMDGCYQRPNGERSLLTFLVYLNDSFRGGETRFQDLVVTPTEGTALVFRHELVHEGSRVIRGCKYAVRSDVMYSPPEA